MRLIMNNEDILKITDHTLLDQTATWEDIRQVVDDSIHYNAASACIPAAYVKQAAEYAAGRLPICTVIGFPNGYSTTAVKVFETKDAIANGAEEIDMVINIGFLKDKRYQEVEDEIHQIHEACNGKILKVIIETCLLTEEEKIKISRPLDPHADCMYGRHCHLFGCHWNCRVYDGKQYGAGTGNRLWARTVLLHRYPWLAEIFSAGPL